MDILKTFIKSIIQEKRDSKELSYMIALFPTKETISNILEYRDFIKSKYKFPKELRELKEEELHTTIRWWEPKNKNFDYSKVVSFLKQERLNKIIANTVNVSILGDSLSLMLKNREFQKTFNKVDLIVKNCGAPPSDYPTYKPHLALFYSEDFRENWNLKIKEVPNFKVDFSKIKMVDGNDNEYYVGNLYEKNK